MQNLNNDDDEIDLIQIAKTIWKGKRFVILFSAFFVFICDITSDANLSPEGSPVITKIFFILR